MISSEVQRTLVKSPPELWTELSDPIALARHLGEFGEIRITRVEPEKLVEWQAENTTGRVSMKASGWGTKVTLSVTHEPAAEEPSPEDASGEQPYRLDSAPQTEAAAEDTPAPNGAGLETLHEAPEAKTELETDAGVAIPREPAETTYVEVELDSPTIAEGSASSPIDSTDQNELAQDDEAGGAAPGPERRRGFFARLFGRRTPRAPETEQASLQSEPPPQTAEISDDAATSEEPLGAQVLPGSTPAARTAVENLQARYIVQPAERDAVEVEARNTEPTPTQPAQDAETDTIQAEDGARVSAERAAAVLTGVLDRLGAAHHRPFSRA